MAEEKKEHHVHHEHEHHVHHKKLSWIKIGIAIAIIAVIVILIFVLKSPPVESGSIIKFQYVLSTTNGTVLMNGTDSLTLGKISETFGFVSNKTDEALIGLKKDSEIVINLSGDEAYGPSDPSLISSINRTEKEERIMNVSNSEFGNAFNSPPMINKTYTRTGDSFNYSVINFDSDNVTLKVTLNETRTISLPTGNLTVSQDDNFIYYKITPNIGQTLQIQGQIGKIISFNETSITIDSNPEYVNMDVVMKIKIIDIQKKAKIPNIVKKGGNSGPTMQVFIMSHCPYGVQMLKGVLPVLEKFQGIANIEIRFVSYTMHGAQEELDNKRIICIREEQSDKLIDYLNCFASADGTETGASGCISKTGIDKSALESCISSKADQYMEDDKTFNEQYGVQGSPTVIVEGKEAQINRDPESVKQALCDAFISKPSECSEKLSTASPSPGFGTGTGSGSSASCG